MSDSQRRHKKPDACGAPSPRPTAQQPRPSPPGAMATNNGPRTLPQRQSKNPVNQSSVNSVAASSNNSGAATLPPQKKKKKRVVLTHTAPRQDILRKELEENFPGKQWFDSYDSLDRRMLKEYGKSQNTSNILLGRLPILVLEDQNGNKHWVGLQAAVRDTISYLLEVEADWNPVTAITSRPQGSLKALWEGKLFLGGIKDSSDQDVLEANEISGVVSIHPKDWLWDDTCGRLFKDGPYRYTKHVQLKSGPADIGFTCKQHAIHLDDDPSSDLRAEFRDAFKFMDNYLLQGKNVLVHCKMGQSRSASLLLGYMMFRYYETHLAPPSGEKAPKNFEQQASKDLKDLKETLIKFIGEISMPKDEPNKNLRRKEKGKRRGISTKKFQEQLSRYLEQLAKREVYKKEPMTQRNPTEKKAGGGIIKDAILVLCFMKDLMPTGEILGYWSSRKKTNEHYWIAASEEKAERKGIRVKDHLASFNKFFEDHLEARQQRRPGT